jgi:hypothetical protein
MRKVKFAAALAFACLAATWALAASIRVNDGHSAADFGAGGWTQTFTAKPFASGAVSVISGAAVETLGPTLDLSGRDFASSRRWPAWLRADADCVFVSSPTAAGQRWRPACK